MAKNIFLSIFIGFFCFVITTNILNAYGDISQKYNNIFIFKKHLTIYYLYDIIQLIILQKEKNYELVTTLERHKNIF